MVPVRLARSGRVPLEALVLVISFAVTSVGTLRVPVVVAQCRTEPPSTTMVWPVR
jgi:hypothetical protein